MKVQTGEPPEPGRYVVWFPCAAAQVREWCEPAIATYHGGHWHTVNPPLAWIGPLPIVHQNDWLRGDQWSREEMRQIRFDIGQDRKIIREYDL